MNTLHNRNIFTKRKSLIDVVLPYAGGIFMAWCIVWLIVFAFDGGVR